MIRTWLVNSIKVLLVFCQWAYVAWQVCVVAFSVQSELKAFLTFLP